MIGNPLGQIGGPPPPTGASPGPEPSTPGNGAGVRPPTFDVDEADLFDKLTRRASRRKPLCLSLTDDEETELVKWIDRDFRDAQSANTIYRDKHVEYLRSWRSVVAEDEDLAFEGGSNVRAPMTSYYVEQWKARLLKGLLGGERVAEWTSLDPAIDPDTLSEVNDWFKWELEETVGLRAAMEDILHYVLVDGWDTPIPVYDHQERELASVREFDLIDELPLSEQLLQALLNLWPGEEVTIEKQQSPGIFDLTRKGADKELRKAHVTFSIDGERLVAEVLTTEVVFDGVRIEIPEHENIFVINSAPDVERIPFFGYRIWLSVHDYLVGVDRGVYRKFDTDELNRVIATAQDKQAELDQQTTTEEADIEEGGQSRDLFSVYPSRRWLEVYRWEGWWTPGYEGAAYTTSSEEVAKATVGRDAIQIVAWMAVRSRRVVRVERLEALTKDGERTPVKFEFIRQPDRFYPIGLCQWMEHNQATLDAVYRQRLDSGIVSMIPFGFYEPAAGYEKTVLDLQPGKMYPVKSVAGILFPKLNWNPTWGFQEEALARKSAQEQAGLSDPSVGSFISKRTSATEFEGTMGSTDLRTEVILERLARSLRKLLLRIFGLYQQFMPDGRIFQVTGLEGERVVRRFKRDRLNGKMSLQLTANLQQLSAQLQRDVAINMLSLLLNELLIAQGITKSDTIFAAIKKVAKAMDYRGVPIHKPDMPPESEAPDIEHRKMYAEIPVDPSLIEDKAMHLQAHARMLIDPSIQLWSPTARQLLADHIQKTQQLIQAEQVIKQQQMAQAQQMQGQMAAMGVRPGLAGGQQPGDQAEPGTQEEGVPTGPGEQMGGAS